MIQFDRLSFKYDDNSPVLNDVSLHLPRGALVFLTGRSGAGKTSLLKLLYLANQPTSGSLKLFDKDTAGLSRDQTAHIRRRIGVVFQDFRLLNHLTVEQNVLLPLFAAGNMQEDARNNVRELLEWVELGDRLQHYPLTLSGGEKQRVAIARAMIGAPDIIIADEPTGNVDPDMSIRIMQLLIEMQRLGRTVVIATHDLALAEHFEVPILEIGNSTLTEWSHQ